jgi:hypothetical protein
MPHTQTTIIVALIVDINGKAKSWQQPTSFRQCEQVLKI